MTAGWSAFFGMACGFIYLAWRGFKMASRADEVLAANAELRERLATAQGELNAANERYNARVKRAQDGAKAGVKTKKENREKAGAEPLRINLPVKQAEGATT